jgi:hypothetical protein
METSLALRGPNLAAKGTSLAEKSPILTTGKALWLKQVA